MMVKPDYNFEHLNEHYISYTELISLLHDLFVFYLCIALLLRG